MTLFAAAFPKPVEIRARLFLFDKPIKCFAFSLRSLFTFIFQGKTKVALSTRENVLFISMLSLRNLSLLLFLVGGKILWKGRKHVIADSHFSFCFLNLNLRFVTKS